MLLLGDCNEHLKEINDNSIDLILTDPPYGLEFMGKDWDKVVVPTETWKECYRVLKQGKLAFVMCSPRQDVLSRMIVNLQDAGFRTNYSSIYWTYASGFPKAANVSKLIDKRNGTTEQQSKQFADYIKSKRIELGLSLKYIDDFVCGGSTNYSWFEGRPAGQRLPRQQEYNKIKQILQLDNRFDNFIGEAEREIIGQYIAPDGKKRPMSEDANSIFFQNLKEKGGNNRDITKPATEEAKKMEGAYVGFQPKPAVEVILVVSKGKTLTWLDDCRIPYQNDKDVYYGHHNTSGDGTLFNDTGIDNNVYSKGWKRQPNEENEKGRFPANLLVSDDVLNNGKITKSGGNWEKWGKATGIHSWNQMRVKQGLNQATGKSDHIQKCTKPQDEGSYSRYFSLDQWADKRFTVYNTTKETTPTQPVNPQKTTPAPNHSANAYPEYMKPINKTLAANYEKSNSDTKIYGWSKGGIIKSGAHYPDKSKVHDFDMLPFLITPKASKSERNKGVETLEPVKVNDGRNTPIDNPFQRGETLRTNSHPTVKPLKLMSYLITMGSREGDLILDPFCGSGTALIAADQLHRKWLGIERNPEYAEIIKRRLMIPLSQLKLSIF